MKKICKYCKTENLLFDAWAVWDEELNEYVLEQVFDEAYCGKCDGSSEPINIHNEKEVA